MIAETTFSKPDLVMLLQHICPRFSNNPSSIPEPVSPMHFKKAVAEFMEFVHTHRWMVKNYQGIMKTWQATSYKLLFIGRLQKEDCMRLITMFIHEDEKNNGVLEQACKKGYIKAIIERLLKL